MIVRGKIWGNTATIFDKNNVQIARIEVKKGGYCSNHLHNHRYYVCGANSLSLL